MKVTLGKLVAASPSIEKLVKEDLPARTAYRLSRLLKAAQTELAAFDKARLGLFEKFGEKTEGGGWRTLPDKTGEFTDELSKLQDEEVDLWYERVTIEMLSDAKLSAVDMMLLEPFVVEEATK